MELINFSLNIFTFRVYITFKIFDLSNDQLLRFNNSHLLVPRKLH